MRISKSGDDQLAVAIDRTQLFHFRSPLIYLTTGCLLMLENHLRTGLTLNLWSLHLYTFIAPLSNMHTTIQSICICHNNFNFIFIMVIINLKYTQLHQTHFPYPNTIIPALPALHPCSGCWSGSLIVFRMLVRGLATACYLICINLEAIE